MIEKIKLFFVEKWEKVTNHPACVKLSGIILTKLLAFFSCIGPVLGFFCGKRPDAAESKSGKKFSEQVIATF